MKIRIVSDLHLEFSDVDIPNDEGCDVLILSGDIMVVDDLYKRPSPDPYTPGAMGRFSQRLQSAILYRNFLTRVSRDYPHVIYVAGNHEFYDGRFYKTIDILKEEVAAFPNIHVLEMEAIKIDDVTFVGGTLWTDMNRNDPLTLHAIKNMMNDFRFIRNDYEGFRALRPEDVAMRHAKTLKYIQKVIEGRFDEKFVVVGHHAPTRLSTHPKYVDDFLMNGGYSSDLSEFIMDHPQIRLWTHGHTHHPFDYVVGETRIVCNPRGYGHFEPDTGWNPKIAVEI